MVTNANPHELSLVTYLFRFRVVTLWIVSSLFTWGLLIIPTDSVLFIIAVAVYALYAVVFFNYGFDVIESTARGHNEPPPFLRSLTSERTRLFRQVMVIAIGASLLELTPDPFGWLTLSVMLAVAPAISSFIVFHEPLLVALNPKRIWQFIANMGFGYVALRLLTTSVLLLGLYVASGELEFASTTQGMALVSAGFVLLVLVMFRTTGTLLHLRREALGIRTEFSAEQSEQNAQEASKQEVRDYLEPVKLEFRLNGTEKAYALLELQLKRHRYRDDGLVYELLREMSDRRLLYRFAGGYIGRLVETEVSHAWSVLDEMYREAGAAFKMQSGASLFQLATTAETRHEREMLLNLLEGFEGHYPKHPGVRQAWLHAAELALLLNDEQRARSNIDKVNARTGELDVSQLNRCSLQLS